MCSVMSLQCLCTCQTRRVPAHPSPPHTRHHTPLSRPVPFPRLVTLGAGMPHGQAHAPMPPPSPMPPPTDTSVNSGGRQVRQGHVWCVVVYGSSVCVCVCKGARRVMCMEQSARKEVVSEITALQIPLLYSRALLPPSPTPHTLRLCSPPPPFLCFISGHCCLSPPPATPSSATPTHPPLLSMQGHHNGRAWPSAALAWAPTWGQRMPRQTRT